MFSDEEVPFTFNSMHEFSTVDGFVEITESLAEMIKYLANEPSVGLFYVQQHTQSAVPNLINLKNNVSERSRNMSLHTEDSEDSIAMVRSMKDCGFPIADEMIKDIKKSLAIISTKQPKKGLISSPSFGFQMGSTTSWGPSSWGLNDGESASASNYFSTVFKSAKQKASNLKWAQLDTKESIETKNEKFVSYPKPPLEFSAASTSATTMEGDGDELPVSSPTADKIQEEEEEESQVNKSLSSDKLLALSEDFDEFRADREAKLEEWLGGSDNQSG